MGNVPKFDKLDIFMLALLCILHIVMETLRAPIKTSKEIINWVRKK